MKKVGILTFQWFDNYGTVLQAYGLQTALKQLGYEAHIIPLKVHERQGLFRILSKSLKGICFNLSRYCADHGGRRHRGYMQFREKYFDYGGLEPMFFNEALRYDFAEDTLIWGSDNVWSPWCVGMNNSMGQVFFGNGIRHTHKITYAASTAGYLSSYSKWREVLKIIGDSNFSAIALRERVNCELFRKAGFEVTETPDPAFLLTQDQWRNVESVPKKVSNRPYIFGYDLGHKGFSTIRSCCEIVAKKNNAEVKMPYPSEFWSNWDIACYASPQEWLWYIRNAEAVVTNSFHGVMFSIIFNRPFIYVPIQGEDMSLNMRAVEVLESVCLKCRQFDGLDDLDSLMHTPIDWSAVNERVRQIRQIGLSYLVKNI